jgi:glycosidase
MVDQFNNDKASPKNLPFDASFGQFQGGSFAGARAKLPYLKATGFGAIWLSPVLKNPSYDPSAYHGYGIQNFLAAEPRFASTPTAADAELRQLVDAAHALGLYVILDIILHHAGNVFAYRTAGGFQDQVDWQNQPIPVGWKNAAGTPDPISTTAPTAPTLDAAVSPREFCRNELFTRQGNIFSAGGQVQGDFDALKGISFDLPGAGEPLAYQILIRAYQYIVAKFDVDGFRIDSLMYVPADFERVFANAMREYALTARARRTSSPSARSTAMRWPAHQGARAQVRRDRADLLPLEVEIRRHGGQRGEEDERP